MIRTTQYASCNTQADMALYPPSYLINHVRMKSKAFQFLLIFLIHETPVQAMKTDPCQQLHKVMAVRTTHQIKAY